MHKDKRTETDNCTGVTKTYKCTLLELMNARVGEDGSTGPHIERRSAAGFDRIGKQAGTLLILKTGIA